MGAWAAGTSCGDGTREGTGVAIAPQQVRRQWWLCQHEQGEAGPGSPGMELPPTGLGIRVWGNSSLGQLPHLLDFTHSALCFFCYLQLNPQPEPLSWMLSLILFPHHFQTQGCEPTQDGL